MMPELTHQQTSEMLADAALDALAADEQTAVLAHAATCATCGPALAALRDATTQLAFAVPRAPDDPAGRARVRTRLLARARADLAVADVDASADANSDASSGGPPPAGDAGVADRLRRAETTRSPGDRIGRRAPSLIAAWSVAGLIGVTAVVVVTILDARLSDDGQQMARVRATDSTRIAHLEGSVSAQDSTLRELTGNQVSMIHLTSAPPGAAWAWMFWNHATNRWTLLAHNLPAAPIGKTYQLWLVTPRARISAGTFTPQPNGSAELHATYSVGRDSLRTIAVTQEPVGGVPQPTGPFVIAATAGQ